MPCTVLETEAGFPADTRLLLCLVPGLLEIALTWGGAALTWGGAAFTGLWNLGGRQAHDAGQEEMGVCCRTNPPGQH